MAGSHPSTIGKYTVLSVLGRGGMGIVYKARDPIIDRIVAIKTISVTQELSTAELRKRLQMEAQSAGRLQHPNIATLYDFGTFGDTPYIVMEYVEGTDLARLIEQKTPLTLPQKFDILIQIGHGLAYAHELDVVHRDMKPSNIRVTNRCTAKIIDFGLARFDSTRLTQTGFMSGTIAYMSPERISGTEGPSDDIFALGTIAYELLTGTRAFPGSTPPEVIMRIISQSPPVPSTVAPLPPELDPIVMKGLAREVSDRYASAAELTDALAEFRHSTVLREFMSSEPGTADYSPDSRRVRTNAITLMLPVDAEEVPTAMMARPESADATLVESSTAGTAFDSAPTAIESQTSEGPTTVEPRPAAARSFAMRGAIGATILIAGTIAVLLIGTDGGRRTGQAEDARPAAITGPAVPVGTAREAVTVVPPHVMGQRLLLTQVQNDLESLALDPTEQARFTEARAEAEKAEAKYRQQDYQSTAELLSGALRVMSELKRDHYQRLAGAARQPSVLDGGSSATRKSSTPARVPPSKPEQQRPQVAAEPRPTAAPPPAVRPKPEPAPSSVPERDAVNVPVRNRAEIAAFVLRLAKAYEARDVTFFREHDMSYNDRLANAIRNSPSVSVRMDIESIELSGDDRARVRVVRTDRFEARNMPPGVQRVTYDLVRSGDTWKIASMSRVATP